MADFSANHLVQFGGSTVVTYLKRGRDSNVAAPPVPGSYVYWESTDPAGPYPDPPPFGGPIVEETVLRATTS